jgi:hypothetical protein
MLFMQFTDFMFEAATIIECAYVIFHQATDGFLFVVQCDTGCVIYVSDSVTPVLSYSQVTEFL